MYNFLTYTMMFLQTFVGLILVAIILLQRGRGGGLAGALGGMGGQSAFGNKAGDLFTRITVVLATVWIVLSCVCVLLASGSRNTSTRIKPALGTEVIKQAPEAGDNKDVVPGPGPGSPPDTKADEKPEGDKSTPPAAAADPKAAKPDDTKPDDTKPAATDKPDDVKKDEKPEATEPKPEAKDEDKEAKPEVKEEKPADPVKKVEGEAAATDKESIDKKPE